MNRGPKNRPKLGIPGKQYGKATLPGTKGIDKAEKMKYTAKDAAHFFPELKPMLAEKMGDIEKLKYPVLATPKIDGIRCLTGLDGVPLSRSLKTIPNKYIQAQFKEWGMEGLDGELYAPPEDLYDTSFGTVSGAIMKADGEPDFKYLVFDVWDRPYDAYSERVKALEYRLAPPRPPWVKILKPVKCINAEGVMKYWSKCADDRYEGAMVRDPDGRYLYKRSTQGALMKLKIFQDDDAIIIGFEEMMHNTNEAKKNALGRTERSTAKAGMVPAGVLGKWVCRDLKTNIEFEVGTGFTAKQRSDFWRDRQVYVGEIIKYKHQPAGALSKPRFPVFLGFRHRDDL